MGYYIQGPPKGKARYLVENHDAIELTGPSFPHPPDTIPDDHAVVCVVDNGMFEAAALLYNKDELEEFSNPNDRRPKTFLLMDRKKAYELAGYAGR